MLDSLKQERCGKFTSSRINDLMGIKGLGKTGETYAFEMAVECVFGIDPDDDYVSFDMQRGIDLEPLAFEHFKQEVSKDFLNVSTCSYIPLNEYSGGTPDGMVNEKWPLEIKCPKRDKFFRLVVDGIIDQCYIDQCQHQMLCTGGDRAYFRNFIIHNGVPIAHTIIIERDEVRIDLMKDRIKEAVSLREGFINKLKELL